MTVNIYHNDVLQVSFSNQETDFCALKWLLDNQSCSCDHAIKYEGYKVELVDGDKVDYWEPYKKQNENIRSKNKN